MRQIKVPQAKAITGGSPAVVVGDIDTGLDKDHPDLAPNIAFDKTVSCESGVPKPGAGRLGRPRRPWNAHGRDDRGDNCKNDPDQRLLWKAAQRAIIYAYKRGVTNFASAGNQSDDLAHPTFDDISPDFPPRSEEEREITNACVVVPVEVQGVIGVSAVGNTTQVDGDDDPNDYLKSYYSSYGVGVAEVTAPGGDFYYGRGTEGQPFGLVLSTWPTEIPCGRSRQDVAPGVGTVQYCYLQGTSMSSPHAAGVGALIVSVFGDANNPRNGKMRPGSVEQYMQHTADPQPCPTELPLQGAAGSSRANTPYLVGAPRPDGSQQECQGGEGYNSWYGSGQVNALSAILHDTSNN